LWGNAIDALCLNGQLSHNSHALLTATWDTAADRPESVVTGLLLQVVGKNA
jgi:hypothetical protein